MSKYERSRHGYHNQHRGSRPFVRRRSKTPSTIRDLLATKPDELLTALREHQFQLMRKDWREAVITVLSYDLQEGTVQLRLTGGVNAGVHTHKIATLNSVQFVEGEFARFRERCGKLLQSVE